MSVWYNYAKIRSENYLKFMKSINKDNYNWFSHTYEIKYNNKLSNFFINEKLFLKN